MQSWSKAFQAAKAQTAARKAAEEEKKIKDNHAGKGALGVGTQRMQAEADEKKKQEDEGKMEKQPLYERTKQEQTNYVEELLSEMDRLDLDTDVGTALKKNEALILRCLTQAGVSNGKKGIMIAKGGGDIGLLSKNTKIIVVEGHYTAFIVKAMQYTEETWPKRASAALSISQEARQLSFVITALKEDSLLSQAMIKNFLGRLDLQPSDPNIQSVAEVKWNKSAQGAPIPQYRVTLGDNVEWPLRFIEALSSGPNVTMEGNYGRVEKAT